MPEGEITPTHSAFLELKDERDGMREGYGFLDEKRLILASAILDELSRYEREMTSFRQLCEQAITALRGAVARHGLDGLELYPKASIACDGLRRAYRSVLGVTVQTAAWESSEAQASPPAVNPSAEAEVCRAAFVDLVLRAARLAVHAGNLERLRLEYTRTARWARALEDVLLPEIADRLDVIGAALEEFEREEAIRVRQVRKAR